MGGGGGRCGNLGGWQDWFPLRSDLIQLGSRLLRASLGCEELPGADRDQDVDEPHSVPSGAVVEVQCLRFFPESCGCHASQKAGTDKCQQEFWGGQICQDQSWRCRQIRERQGSRTELPHGQGQAVRSCLPAGRRPHALPGVSPSEAPSLTSSANGCTSTYHPKPLFPYLLGAPRPLPRGWTSSPPPPPPPPPPDAAPGAQPLPPARG